MVIQRAEPKHLDDVTRLGLKLWPDHDWSELREEFEDLLQSDHDAIYIALAENQVVGFLHMSLRTDYVEGSTTSPVGYVEGIFVEEEYRNRGIAKRLVQAGEQWVKTMGCKEVASDTELHNQASQAFHKKIGFTEAARIVAFIKRLE